MKPIEFTLAPTVVIETPQTLEDLLKELGLFTYTVQILEFKSLEQVSAYRIQKAHLEREDKVYLLNKETLELAYIPKVGVDAMTLLLSTKGILVLETLEANPVI
jgi:hypothetical protein